MRQYLAPFGFDTRRVTRPIIARGIDAGDQIVLLQPAANRDETIDNNDSYAAQEAAAAVSDLTDFFKQIDEQIRITTALITCHPFEISVREVSALITDPARAARVGTPENDAARNAPPLGTKAVEMTLCLGGGARELLLATHTAAAAHRTHIDHIVLLGDLSNQPTEVALPQVNPHIPDRVTDTFQAFVDATPALTKTRITEMDDAVATQLTVTEITDRTGQSKSTVGRHLDVLESEGVVDSERDGKQRIARLTLTAELLLRDMQRRNSGF